MFFLKLFFAINTILMIMMTLSFTFILLNHPLSMGLFLLIMTVMTSLTTGLMNTTFWFSYILFLVMIGGMLILFIYMTSVASNEKFKFSFKIMYFSMSIFMISVMLNMNQNLKLKEINSFNNFNNLMTMNLKYFSPSMKFILIFSMIYLLITLIMTVYITKKNMGPLRSKI
uniref:NADH-ubiquinone oxidoreductase chain 6 n=1 Tax=Colasposoma dauricum TaxID=1301243 RepID=A0A8A5L732_9CUCU|nr:NADH dehydrogenase subunit 6 [Colasposoma dauricum]